MKVHPYFYFTTPWWVINRSMKPIDRHVVLLRVGKTLRVIQ